MQLVVAKFLLVLTVWTFFLELHGIVNSSYGQNYFEVAWSQPAPCKDVLVANYAGGAFGVTSLAMLFVLFYLLTLWVRRRYANYFFLMGWSFVTMVFIMLSIALPWGLRVNCPSSRLNVSGGVYVAFILSAIIFVVLVLNTVLIRCPDTWEHRHCSCFGRETVHSGGEVALPDASDLLLRSLRRWYRNGPTLEHL